MSAINSRQQRGKQAEEKAAKYLQQHGLEVVTRNFRTKCGEIDLIMSEKNVTIFVEVRYRSSLQFMDAIETINKSKVQRIILASRYYLQSRPTSNNVYRFDIVTLTGDLEAPEITWTKNAFNTESL